MKIDFRSKKILITGASRGIGLNVAQSLLNYSTGSVMLASRTLNNKTKVLLKNKNYNHLKVDFEKETSLKKFINKLKFIKFFPDIVINNVGGNLNLNDPLSGTDDWKRVLQLNLFTSIEINKFCIPEMQKKNWGRICHVSSISAIENQGSPLYGAAKAALCAYVKSVGRFYSKSNIVITSILPGATYTENGYWDIKKKTDKKKYTDFIKDRMAIGRLGNVGEVSSLIIFLCSQNSSFCAGSNILVDGGQTRAYNVI
jgi:3-oxoacyl-[acyl-carrier protein] reductase